MTNLTADAVPPQRLTAVRTLTGLAVHAAHPDQPDTVCGRHPTRVVDENINCVHCCKRVGINPYTVIRTPPTRVPTGPAPTS